MFLSLLLGSGCQCRFRALGSVCWALRELPIRRGSRERVDLTFVFGFLILSTCIRTGCRLVMEFNGPPLSLCKGFQWVSNEFVGGMRWGYPLLWEGRGSRGGLKRNGEGSWEMMEYMAFGLSMVHQKGFSCVCDLKRRRGY